LRQLQCLSFIFWDEALVEVARRLKSCLPDSDLISRPVGGSSIRRFGGDEFLVLLNGIKQFENATPIGNRILNVLSKPIQLEDQSIPIAASIGIALGSRDSGAAEELLSNASSAMSQAKTNGESRLCLFDKAVRVEAAQRLTLEADMSQGLRQGQFEVHYQPIVSLKSGVIEGFEALLRWHHPTQGLISAGHFITIAENLGKIVELGSRALKQACQQLHTWQSSHPNLAHAYISVNISTREFFDPDFANTVVRRLEETGLAANNLKLEIPESVLATDSEMCTKTLNTLHKIGVRFSLDDFGGGYSSLSYVQQFPIDTIKIDRSLIAQMKESVQSQELVKGIVEGAHGFGMSVTAKGVESQSQAAMLRDFGCETGQGMLYASPVPHSAIET
jgi:diguanylate cyclase (GGDEF)-like protein